MAKKRGSRSAASRTKRRRGSEAMTKLRLWLVAGALLVVALLSVCEIVASGRAGLAAERLFGARSVAGRAAEIDRAIGAALVEVGAFAVTRTEETREAGRSVWPHRRIEGKIPKGGELFSANLAITTATRRARGSVIRGLESDPDWRGCRTLELRLGVRGRETHRVVLRESPERTAATVAGSTPRIAIVIDDFGYNESETALGFMRLDTPVTCAVLPYCPHTRPMAEAAHRAGKEVILHLPMEPEGYPDRDPGENALLVGQSGAEIRRLVESALAEVPYAVGVNNHMGSAFVQKRRSMSIVMGVLGDRGLFFLDSMTTPLSVGFAEAERAGIPAARNVMFLDSGVDEGHAVDVETKLRDLESSARRRGEVVAIGHPRPETLDALRRAIPGMEARGIEFVYVSELAE